MFGSNDDKKAPAEAGEKKGLFGWFRKKPQQAVAEQPQTPETKVAEPVAPVEQAAPVAPAALAEPEPVLLEAAPEIAPQPPV